MTCAPECWTPAYCSASGGELPPGGPPFDIAAVRARLLWRLASEGGRCLACDGEAVCECRECGAPLCREHSAARDFDSYCLGPHLLA